MSGSYGILDVAPIGYTLPERQNPIDQALKSARNVYDIFGQHYDNKLKDSQARISDMKAQQQAATMESAINAENTKNNADIKFYPLQQEANLGHTRAQIEEQLSKSGLNRADAKAAAARAVASYAEANLHNANARSAGFQGDINNEYLKNMMFGSKNRGAGGTYVDPQTGKVISTPTNSVTTQNQKTIQAVDRAKPLMQDLIKNMPQFQTLSQKGALAAQKIGNLLGGNYPLPDQYAQGQMDLKVAPESLVKAWGINATNETLANIERAIQPMSGETAKGYENRVNKFMQDMRNNQIAAQNAQSQGYDVTPQQEVASGFNGNPNLPQQQGPGPQLPQQPQNVQQMAQYDAWAKDAIAKGADPEKVNQKLAQLMGRG